MEGKEVGTIRTRKVEYVGESGKEEIYMVDLADSLHTSLMISNWGTTRREVSDKIRRVGSEFVKSNTAKYRDGIILVDMQ